MEAYPAVDPIPLPAPVWLFKVLHALTLETHFIAVHFMVGGLLLAVVWNIAGRRRSNPTLLNASGAITHRLPVVMAYVLNLAIPPLLFAQVLYGRALYTSSVLIGVYWLAIIFLFIAAYFLMYMMSNRADNSRAYGWIGLIAILIVLKVGVILSTNMTLMLRPDMWVEIYRSNQLGSRLPGGDPTTMPRWLFMMIGSVGVSGVALMLLSLQHNFPDDTIHFLRRWGGRLLAIFTVVQVGVAFRVLSTQPESVKAGLSASAYYSTLGYGWLLTAALLIVIGAAIGFAGRRGGLWIGGTGLLSFLNLGLLVLFRDGIRDISLLQQGYDVWGREINTNWSTVILFVVLLVAAIGFCGWMAWIVGTAKKELETYA